VFNDIWLYLTNIGPLNCRGFKPHPKSLSKREGLEEVSPFGGDLEGASRAAIILPLFYPLIAPLLQKLAMPLQPHRPPLFCPFSPEAYLLTGREEKQDCKSQEARKKKPYHCAA
jgi:hypothetical protein